MRLTAVIPAAGRGSRIGLSCPKLFAPLGSNQTVWELLRHKLDPYVEHIHVVLSPDGMAYAEPFLRQDALAGRVSVGCQARPLGMGDAVFSASEQWKPFDAILVLWGDQVHVSPKTLHDTILHHRSGTHPGFTLPLVRLLRPYVQYRMNETGQLMDILQQREGDTVDEVGLSDVGTFLLDTENLRACWDRYLAQAGRGSVTGEVNFLPFLPYLAGDCGWRSSLFEIPDPVEARGINTPADLAYFQALYRHDS